MTFTSLEFILFLILSFSIYWLIPKKNLIQNVIIIIAGLIFYAYWDWRVVTLFAGSVICTYTAACINKKVVTIASVLLLLGLLGVFKYFNFFMSSLGFQTRLNLILPLGISFYTFMAISYLVDVHKKQNACEKNFITFASYMMFFPQIAAGPISRADKMLPQYRQARQFNYALAVEGCRQMLWGFFKKILVADTCAIHVNQLLVPGQTSAIGLWIGAILYTIQIYADFSGYSDMAIGCGKLFGIRLMRNFSYPYFARNITEFWRRWHISLTTWFRDYVYIPLGGNRCTLMRTFFNTMIVFLVSGLWHGASWTFVVWGGLHGLCFLPVLIRGKYAKPLPGIIAYSITLIVIIIGWVFFRAPNIKTGALWVKNMLIPLDLNIKGLGLGFITSAVAFSILMLISEWLGRNYEVIPISKWRPIRWLVYILLIVGIFYFYPESETFIYWQF